MSWTTVQHVYRANSLAELDWIEHGFGTAHSHDWNRQDDLISLSQVHSDICVYAGGGAGRIGTGDALITDVAGLRIGVRTADCVPVLLADPVHKAVAAIHAGWRGTAQSIVPKVVLAMSERFGSAPGKLLAAVGPAVGPCCYQVGGEVSARFRAWFPERDDLNGPARLDLPEVNRRQLLDAGLSPLHISVCGVCTCCAGEDFHSWRRQPEEGRRMVNSLEIKNLGDYRG